MVMYINAPEVNNLLYLDAECCKENTSKTHITNNLKKLQYILTKVAINENNIGSVVTFI